MTDYLRNLPVQQVAGWYRRLADRIALESFDGNEPLASRFLRHWLDNRDPSSVHHFTAPAQLRSNSYVDATLRYHRAVFLSERQARFTGGRHAWAGVVPRLQGVAGFTRWNMTQPLEMQYESLVEVGSNPWTSSRFRPGERPRSGIC